MIRVREVIEDGEIDGKDSHGGTADGDCGDDPVRCRERRPTEPEQPNREKGTFYAGEIESSFGS